MNILAVDTSSQALYAVLRTEKGCFFHTDSNQMMQHSENLMPSVLDLCYKAEIKPTDIDLFACTRGPGSFTGLRIGMAALKGMSYGAKKPLVSFSTLETWARTIDDFDGAVISAIDAKKQRYYLASFVCSNGQCKRLTEDCDANAENLVRIMKENGNILVTGPDCETFAAILKEMYPENNIKTEADSSKFINALLKLAEETFNNAGPDDIGQGPVYLRKSDAEIALEEKQAGKSND